MANSSRHYTLAILTATLAVNLLDRSVLAITLNQIGIDLSLSDTQLGLVSGAFFAVVYVLFGFPVARLAARGNRRNIVSYAVTIWSVLTIFMAGAQNFTHLALARIGVGIGEAGTIPPAHSMISDLYPEEKRASAMATFAMGANIGVFLAFIIGGIAGQMLGWRWAFVIAGVPGLLLALLLRFTVREPERAAHRETKIADRSLLVATVKMIWKDAGLFHAMWALGLTGVVTHGVLAWNAVFIIRAHELSQTQTGIYLGLTIGLLGGAGTWASGALADRLGVADPRWRFGVVVLGILLAKPFVFGFLLLQSTPLALACFAVSASLATVFWGPTHAFVHSRVEDKMRPMATAIFMFVFNSLGMGLGPFLIGFASEYIFTQDGARSLSYAIGLVQIAGIWAAWHYWKVIQMIDGRGRS